MDSFKRDGGHVDQVRMAVEAAIKAEVTQVGRRPLLILRVVAKDRDGDAAVVGAGETGTGCGCGERICNVEYKFVVAADMRPNQRIARSEEHTSELQSRQYLVCRLLL